jgi:hypothetical protein
MLTNLFGNEMVIDFDLQTQFGGVVERMKTKLFYSFLFVCNDLFYFILCFYFLNRILCEWDFK